MWNTLDVVAENQRLDKDKFVEFALKHRKKYHLDDHDMVGTWYVDDLINDFKKHQSRGPHMTRKEIASEMTKIAKMMTGASETALALEAGKALIGISHENYTTSEPAWDKAEIANLKVKGVDFKFNDQGNGKATAVTKVKLGSSYSFDTVKGYVGGQDIEYVITMKTIYLPTK